MAILDDFNRIAESPITGLDWGKLISGASNNLNLASNQVACNGSSTGESYWIPKTFGPDVEVFVTVATLPGTGNAVRVHARLQQPGGAGSQDGYQIRTNQVSGSANDQVFIERIDNNAITTIATFTQELATGDKVGIRCVGTTIEAWYKSGAGAWTKLGQATDATYSADGYVGVGIRGTAGRIDDFSVGTITDGGASAFGAFATLLDDFNRSNETPLSGVRLWTSRGVGNQLAVNANQCAASNTALNSDYYSASSFGPDCEVYVTVATLGPSGDYLRLYLRLANPGSSTETGYMMQWANDANGCRIFSETARETFTLLAQAASATFSAGDEIAFAASGSTLTVFQNGVAVLTVADSTFSAAGFLALGIDNLTMRLDDFGERAPGSHPTSLIKTILGIVYPSNVKTIEGIAQASVKTVEGLA